MYNGQLPDTAKAILHQHAIQGDLIELHEALWYIIFTHYSLKKPFK